MSSRRESRLLYLRLRKEEFEKILEYGREHDMSLAVAGIHLLRRGLELSLSESPAPDILV